MALELRRNQRDMSAFGRRNQVHQQPLPSRSLGAAYYAGYGAESAVDEHGDEVTGFIDR